MFSIISSAIGFGLGSSLQTTLLIGDMAFIHDINSLHLLKKYKININIVLINNNGGGIFHFLPINDHKEIFEDYFAIPHYFEFSHIAKSFDIRYFRPKTKKEFIDFYVASLKDKGPSIIETKTDRKHDFNLRRKIKKEIIDKISRIS